jgi:hypothetical protein
MISCHKKPELGGATSRSDRGQGLQIVVILQRKEEDNRRPKRNWGSYL